MAPKEITPNANKIKVLAQKTGGKEITPIQGTLDLHIEKEGTVGVIGMGVLGDGTAYLNQRGLRDIFMSSMKHTQLSMN